MEYMALYELVRGGRGAAARAAEGAAPDHVAPSRRGSCGGMPDGLLGRQGRHSPNGGCAGFGEGGWRASARAQARAAEWPPHPTRPLETGNAIPQCYALLVLIWAFVAGKTRTRFPSPVSSPAPPQEAAWGRRAAGGAGSGGCEPRPGPETDLPPAGSQSACRDNHGPRTPLRHGDVVCVWCPPWKTCMSQPTSKPHSQRKARGADKGRICT